MYVMVSLWKYMRAVYMETETFMSGVGNVPCSMLRTYVKSGLKTSLTFQTHAATLFMLLGFSQVSNPHTMQTGKKNENERLEYGGKRYNTIIRYRAFRKSFRSARRTGSETEGFFLVMLLYLGICSNDAALLCACLPACLPASSKFKYVGCSLVSLLVRGGMRLWYWAGGGGCSEEHVEGADLLVPRYQHRAKPAAKEVK